MTTQQPPAGWYPDPHGNPGQRYWDGQHWLDSNMPAQAAAQLPVEQALGFGNPSPGGVDVYGRPLSDKSKLVAGLLQIFLGSLGIGRFYLGYTTIGVLQIVVTVCTCGLGAIWPLIDGILIILGRVPDPQGRTLRE